ncbi:MAG TPA: biotin transporter BioY [Anaerolineales bacterium]|jgi:biotin transport system substrate-specific component|nr:biotin transporter BioY [Anaerolineales bacterium]HQX16726.1 biotin transporter BioY [Anaerolineales bacterium]
MTTLAPTLSTRYFPNISSRIRDILLIVAGSLLVAALAQIEIPLPFTPVPITGQTFGVLLIGAALGSKRGAAALILYILEGGLGLPFFAGGSRGLGILTGATAGYLAGFVVAAYVVGLLAERGLERSVRTSIIPFIVGTVIIYLFGVAWLGIFLKSFSKAVEFGLVPFLFGDAIKLILASLALPAAWKFVK